MHLPVASSSRLTETDPSVRPKARASRACSSCNRQKLRCDGAQPCSRCLTLAIVGSCEYLPSLRGKTRRRKDQSRETEDDGSKRNRIDSEEDVESQRQKEDPRLTMWHKDNAYREFAPTNAALWGEDTVRFPTMNGVPSLPSASPDLSRSGPHRRNVSMSEKLTSLPLPGDAHNPLAVLAEASATAHSDHDVNSPHTTFQDGSRDLKTEEAGGYYMPMEREMKDEAPHIMSYIKVHEAEQLFEMYFKYLHPHLPILDREHSSPIAVARRNNFLFNAICCVAARAFNLVLWERLKDFARFEMERLPRDKNIEVVQGHLIYAMWNLIRPASFERDMSWLRVGVAVRTAIDVNLHRVALVKQAREGLPAWLLRSIIRTWLLSYVIDRTLSAQLGKPSSMRGENSIRLYMDLIMEKGVPLTPDDVWVAALTEWTQILARAMDVFRSETAEYSNVASGSVGNQNSFPDLVHVFDKQFRQWRDKSENAARECRSDERATGFMIGNMRLYDQYARLVVHSFGLQRAMDVLPMDLPAAFAEYQGSAIRLINCFETDFEGPGLTRGCPDFVFTVLTYAAVSLLKATQSQFSYLEPDRSAILLTGRKAADMLARAAMVSDHLPASQSVFLSRLIDVKTHEPARDPTIFIPQPIDFEAFGQSINEDQYKTLWPPMPGSSFEGSIVPAQPRQENGNRPMDLSSWVAQNQTYPVPGAALGLGAGNFLQDQDMLFTQDSFWQSILEGTQAPMNGMV